MVELAMQVAQAGKCPGLKSFTSVVLVIVITVLALKGAKCLPNAGTGNKIDNQ
jgi:hypothetical protein